MPRYLTDYKTNSVIFTSDGTFTAPPGVSLVYVTVVGGGGGGGGGRGGGAANNGNAVGGGGGGGGGGGVTITNMPILLSVTESVPVTIGQGGYGGVGGSGSRTVDGGNGQIGYDGGPGGSTSFGVYLTALGGFAGRYVSPGPVTTYGMSFAISSSVLGEGFKDVSIGETRSLLDATITIAYAGGAAGGSGSLFDTLAARAGGHVYIITGSSIWTTPYRGGSAGFIGNTGSYGANGAGGTGGGGGGAASMFGTGGNGADGPNWSGSASPGTGSLGTSGSLGYGYGSGGGGGSGGASAPRNLTVPTNSYGGAGGTGAPGSPGMCIVRWIL